MVVTEVMRRRVRLPVSGMAEVVAALRTVVPVVTLLVGLCMRPQPWSISCPITVEMVETPSPVIHTASGTDPLHTRVQEVMLQVDLSKTLAPDAAQYLERQLIPIWAEMMPLSDQGRAARCSPCRESRVCHYPHSSMTGVNLIPAKALPPPTQEREETLLEGASEVGTL
ncbi:hypothetical protein BC826DRAFT_219282 [Russula brevipes]|nr:hypothetical protein BC826DRAFT_219282 [Russula brevipes]